MEIQWVPLWVPLDLYCFFLLVLKPFINKENDRIAIFSCYNTVNSKWHDWEPNPDLLAEMPAMRQTLFRPVRAANNLIGEK